MENALSPQTLENSRIQYVERDGVRWYIMSGIYKYLGYQSGHKMVGNYPNQAGAEKVYVKLPYAVRERVIVSESNLRYILSKSRMAKTPDLIKLLGFGDIGFSPCKEALHIGHIRAMFPRYDFRTQYKADKYRVDLYSPRYNIAIECDEFGHATRDPIYEAERQKKINEVLDNPSWVRFNPDAPSFSIVDVVAQITTIVDEKFDLCKCLTG